MFITKGHNHFIIQTLHITHYIQHNYINPSLSVGLYPIDILYISFLKDNIHQNKISNCYLFILRKKKQKIFYSFNRNCFFYKSSWGRICPVNCSFKHLRRKVNKQPSHIGKQAKRAMFVNAIYIPWLYSITVFIHHTHFYRIFLVIYLNSQTVAIQTPWHFYPLQATIHHFSKE